MNKQQFLTAIRERLGGLPEGDLDRSLDYYREMIEERMEDGFTEEKAVAAMGPVEDIAEQILRDLSLPQPLAAEPAEYRPSRARKVWKIVLLVLGSPVWFPLLLAAGIILLALYIVVWAVLISFYAADLSFAVGTLGGFIGFVVQLVVGNWIQAFLFLGAGLICAGLAIFAFFGCNLLARYAVKLGALPARWVRSWTNRKGEL